MQRRRAAQKGVAQGDAVGDSGAVVANGISSGSRAERCRRGQRSTGSTVDGRRSTVNGVDEATVDGRRSTVDGVDGATVDGVDGATVDGVDGATVNGLTVDGVNGGRRSTGLTGFTANGVDGDNGASAGSGVRNGGGPAVLVGPDARGGLRGRTGRRRNACRLGRA
jgi:hypothetical protein